MTYYNYLGQPMPESATETGNITGTSAGNETVQAPPGDTSVSGGGGGDLLVGSSGDNRYWITDPNDRVQDTNGGIDTEIGWLSLKLAPNVQNLIVHGDFNYAVGNNLDNLITVDGSQWVDGGAGNDVLVGSATQRTTFVERAGEGNDVIYNWNGNAQLDLLGYGFQTPADVRAAMTQVGPDVVIKLSSTESLTVRGVTPASFVDRQFLLPLDTSKLGAMTFDDEFNSLNILDPNTGSGQWRTNFGGNLKDQSAYTLTSNGEQEAYIQAGFQGQGTGDLGVNPFSISNGVLSITAAPSPDNHATYGLPYTSGMLNTLGMFEQKYGYFEAKVAMPNVAGTWPAFWLLPSPYQPNMEGDVFEGLGSTPNVDYRRAYGGSGNDQTMYDNIYKADPNGFHTYGMLWTPTTTTFYFDGNAVLTGPTPTTWTSPMALILNLAVGGWGGTPDASKFPTSLQVDYIHAYALADGSTQVVTGQPELPVDTIKDDGAASGQVNTPMTFADNGQAVTTAHIQVSTAHPTTLPPGKTFMIWEDSGAVFGAVSDGTTLSQQTGLLAGTASQFPGAGTWLTDGKVAFAYYAANASGGKDLWDIVFDPAHNTFVRQDLGAASGTGAINFVATTSGGFAVSWHAPDGTVSARGYDEYAYGGDTPGWYGPTRTLTGDLQGINSQGELIAANGSGQELYHLLNASITTAPQLTLTPNSLSYAEGNSGVTPYSYTVIRTGDTSGSSTVTWSVSGSGTNPADASDFQGGALPQGVLSFAAGETTKTITVNVAGDTTAEPDETFTVALANPANAQVQTGTATGTIQNDDGATASSTLSLEAATVTHAEGNAGTTAYVFTVDRTGATNTGATVAWSVAGSGTNPANAADFQGGALPSGTLTFQTAQTSQTITVYVAGDTNVEPDEGFTVTLTNASGAVIGTATASGVITNDDGASTGGGGSTTSGQTLTETSANQTLAGGAGDDTITAIHGGDTMTGNGGADHFVFQSLPWSASEVTDFTAGTDKIDVSALLSASHYTGSDPIGDGYIKLIANSSGGTWLYFDTDGKGAADQWGTYVATLDHVSAASLTDADFGAGGGSTGGGGTTTTPPTLSLGPTSVSHAEGDSGATAFAFTVTRAGDTSAASSVNWAVAGSGANAASASDFTGGVLPTGSVSFAAGETSKTITVNVAGDTTVESDEQFTVSLSNATGATLGTATATGVITNDDGTSTGGGGSTTSGQTLTETSANQTLAGGAGDDTITAIHGGDTMTGNGGADHFVFQSLPWSASEVTDFTAGTDKIDVSALLSASHYTGSDPIGDGYIKLIANSSGGTWLYFDTDGKGTADQWGTYVATLDHVSAASLTDADFGAGGGSTGGGGTTTTPPTLSLGPTSVSHAEGDSGATAFAFTVTRAGDTSAASSVNWAVAGSGANAASASDFTGGALPTGSVSFAAGETSKTITVNVAGDTTVESDEQFTVSLSNATGATLGTATATGVITNDDTTSTGGGSTPPTLSLGPTSVSHAEGDSGATAFAFTVTRAGDTSAASSVNWAVAGSGANAASASDFTGGVLPTGSVSFAAGETSKTITVNVAGDTTVEPDEQFTVSLSNATGATLGTATASGVITNDDTTSTGGGSTTSGQTLSETSANQTLAGGAGDDTITAIHGGDTMTGNGGADHFVFQALPWSASEVTDFTSGTDKIDVSALLSSVHYSGTDPIADGYVKLVDSGQGRTWLYFDTDGKGTADQWGTYVATIDHMAPSGIAAGDWIFH